MTPATLRNRELGLIHAAAKLLGLDDETYRDMLANITAKPGKPGKRSAADLDWRERRAVIEHLKGAGGGTAKTRPAVPRERAALVRKIRALLINHPTGRLPDSYADGIAQRMFGVDNYTWCQPEQLHKLVQALAVDTQRRG